MTTDAVSNHTGNKGQMRNKIIRASAGTGKTFQLTNRYIRLLLDGVKPEEILAVTFTCKAAGEIFDRVLKRLAEAANSPDGCRALAKDLYGDPAALTQEKVLDTLASFVRNMHRARISTIDSFFDQMAGSFAPELGFPFQWKIVDETVNTRNRQKAIFESLRGGGDADVKKLIFDFFKGETERTLTVQIDDILKEYAGLLHESESDAWFAVPASNRKELSTKEKEELVDRIREGAQETFDATDSKRKDSFAAAAEKMISVYTGPQPESVCGETVFANTVFTQTGKYYDVEFSGGLTDAVRQMYDDVKLKFFRLLKKETEATYHLIADIDAEFETIKAESGEYDFDDVTVHLSKLNEVKQEKLLEYRLDNRTKHLLLDEFQDTSFFQWKVLEPLADAVVEGDGSESSFFCVGDTKQSIYQWRGGMPEIFDHVEREYCTKRRRAEKEPLDTNYRSSPEIIEAVNEVFGTIASCGLLKADLSKIKVKYDAEKKRAVMNAAQKWNDAYNEHKVADRNKDRKGFVSLEEAPIFDNKKPDEWETIFGTPIADQNGLKSAYTARRIKEIHEAKPEASIGVLFRSGAELTSLASRLKQLGVEVSQEGGSPLATAASVRAILALLRVADHPGDSAALARAATIPALLEAIPEEVRPNFERFVLNRKYRAEAGEALSSWLRGRIVTVGPGAFVRGLADRLLPLCNAREAEKLRALITAAFRFEERQNDVLRLDRFVALTETEGVALPGDSNIHFVTIHSSKGLEYDVVVLPELKSKLVRDQSSEKVLAHRPEPTAAPDAIFRYRNKGGFDLLAESFPKAAEAYYDGWLAEANESLNVLYVAMTRARRELIMIADPETRNPEKDGSRKPYTSQELQNILRTQLKAKITSSPSLIPGWGENVYYQIGSADWYDADPEFGAKPVSAAPSRAAAAPPAVPCVPPSESAARVFAPSHKSFHRRWTSDTAKERGLVIHACFERIEWLDAPLTDERFEEIKSAVRAQLFSGKPLPKDFDVYLKGFRRLCGEATVQKFLSRAYYAENYPGLEPRVYRERPYLAAMHGRGRKKGIIDRLVLLYDGDRIAAADIIDYKTDIEVHKGADPALYVSRAGYDRQLSEYRRNVEKMYKLSDASIAARLFFFGCDSGGKTYTLPPFEIARP
ncbi:MAG: UvrD-helicase domain-containing protein [Thermoguttaceae bacterium]|nr:UvrD-helicase domain-containing protein [Thermoguttaceae bacterium]